MGASPDDSVSLRLAGVVEPGVLGSTAPTELSMPSEWGALPFTPRAMATVMAEETGDRRGYVGLMVDAHGGLWNYGVRAEASGDMGWNWADYHLTVARVASGYTGVRDMVAPEPWQVRGGGYKASPHVYLLTTTGLQRAVVTPGLKLYSGKAVADTYGDIVTLAWGGRRSINGVVKDVLVGTTTTGDLVEIRVGSSLTDVSRVVRKTKGFDGLASLGLSYRRSATGVTTGTYTGITATGYRKTWHDANVFIAANTGIQSTPTQVATTIPAHLVEGYFPVASEVGVMMPGFPFANAPFGEASYHDDPNSLGTAGELPNSCRVPTIPKAWVWLNRAPHVTFGVTTDGRLVRYDTACGTSGVAREVVLKTGWTYVRDLVESWDGRYVYVLTGSSVSRWTVSNGALVSGVKVTGDFSDIAELGLFHQYNAGVTGDQLIGTTKTGGLVRFGVPRTSSPTVVRQTWATSGYSGVSAIGGAAFGPGAPRISFVTMVKAGEIYRLMNRNTGGTAALVGLGTQTEDGRYTGHVASTDGRHYY